MPTIKIEVKDKIAKSPTAQIVCGNSDYQIEFAFDEEWAAYDTKTARFVWNGQHADVIFDGNVCPAPIISGATACAVGVFAGDLHTTTPALVACSKSILCEDGAPADPQPDVYAQLLAKYDEISKRLDDEGNAVLTVNGNAPDESGNVSIDMVVLETMIALNVAPILLDNGAILVDNDAAILINM